MTVKAVEAVFFARYTISNFRAVYGRLNPKIDASYTKNFIQVAQAAGSVLEAVLPAPKGSTTDIHYEWPTGGCEGKLEWGKRWHLKWLTNHEPLPWTIGDTSLPEISIPGNRSMTSPASADAEHTAIEGAGTEPWLLGIKLFGEERRLHVRTYFRNPTTQFADRALSQLPVLVQQAIDDLPASEGSGAVQLPPVAHVGTPPPPLRAGRLVAEIQEALKSDPNVLLVGPPGTGKSVALEDLRTLYENRNPAGTVLFDTAVWGNAWSATGPQSRCEVLVFHPSYTYENFVAGLFPKSSTSGIELEARAGPMLCVSHWVGDKDRSALLIIDEFNRGPAAAIFGDCLSLLDKDKRWTKTNGGAHMPRPYSSQLMPVPPSFAEDPAVLEHMADEVRLPAGVHIVAAMNSTDRSVAPLDAAMRRRFSVIRVAPDYEALEQHLTGNAAFTKQPLPSGSAAWSVDDVSTLALQLLKALNDRIEYCLGEDFLLGHALVWNLDAASVDARLKQLATAVDAKVVPTLRMTFIDQDEVLAAVLNVPDTLQVSPGQVIPPDTVAYWKAAPPSLASIAQRRLTVQTLSGMALPEQLKALLALPSS